MRIGFVLNTNGVPKLVVETPLADLFQALGILDAAGDFLKAEYARQTEAPKVQVFHGNVPRT